MAKFSPYERLIDPEAWRAKSAAGLSRTVTALLAVVVVAVVLTVVVLGCLLAYAYLSPDPCASSRSAAGGVPLCRSPGPPAADPSARDVQALLERLDSLEREVAALKSECRRWSSLGSGHDKQQWSDQGSHGAHRPTVQLKLSPDEETPVSTMPTWRTIQTWPPLDDDPPLDPPSPRPQRRNPRSKGDRRRARHWDGDDSPAPGDMEERPPAGDRPQLVPGEGREDGGRGTGKRKRDKRCKHCIDNDRDVVKDIGTDDALQARVLMFGKAAHIQGTREGNIRITDQWIGGPQIWDMTVGAEEYFSLSILGRVVVREGGLYYVYSQVLFYDSNSTVGQSICVNGQPRFTCIKSNISAEAKQSTCYIGGVVRLSGGDVVGVKLSIPNVTVALHADTTYYGLFRVA